MELLEFILKQLYVTNTEAYNFLMAYINTSRCIAYDGCDKCKDKIQQINSLLDKYKQEYHMNIDSIDCNNYLSDKIMDTIIKLIDKIVESKNN